MLLVCKSFRNKGALRSLLIINITLVDCKIECVAPFVAVVVLVVVVIVVVVVDDASAIDAVAFPPVVDAFNVIATSVIGAPVVTVGT